MVVLLAVTVPLGRSAGAPLVTTVLAEVVLVLTAIGLWSRWVSPLRALQFGVLGGLVAMTAAVELMSRTIAAGGVAPLAVSLVAYGGVVSIVAMLVLGPDRGALASIGAQATWLVVAARRPEVRAGLEDGGGLLLVVRWDLMLLILLWGSLRAHVHLRAERDALRAEATDARARRQQQQEEEEQRARRLAEAAHELRAPLATIAAGTETLTDHNGDLAAEHMDRVVIALRRAASRLDERTVDLLQATRDREMAAPVLRTEVDVATLIAEALADVRLLARDHRIITDVAGLSTVRLDPAGVEHIVTNLVHNAVKYTPPGSTIEVRLRRVGSTTVLVVADDGPGVPEGVRPLLFEPYVRDATTRDADGTGVGLAVTRTWARRHGGDVRLLDTEVGAAFEVTLPDG